MKDKDFFRAEVDLGIILILQMKKLRTRAGVRAMITHQERNLDCLSVCGLDESPWRKDHVLWAAPKSESDIVP